MDHNHLFLEIENCYVRTYKVHPSLFEGHAVTVYMECSENKERINGHQYLLNVYFSVDPCPDRSFAIGTTFGEGVMGKDEMDKEIDSWAFSVLMDKFDSYVKDYLQKEKLWNCEMEKRVWKD